jgi:UDP-glucose:(heptosyl)LPS alpha-1,3-glucosyltransferase
LTKEKFLREFTVDPDKIQIVYPGVDIDKFSRLDRQRCRQEIRRRCGLGEADRVLLFVSMNFGLKGLDNLIASMARIKAKQANAKLKLLVAGKGNEKKYSRLARECGLAGDVIFSGIWRDDIEKVYLASDIFSIRLHRQTGLREERGIGLSEETCPVFPVRTKAARTAG